MLRNGRYGKKIALFGTLAVAAFTMVAGTALAETAGTSATLTAGNLSITKALTAGTFTGTLNGAPQTLSSTTFSGFNTQDARGSGSGWNGSTPAARSCSSRNCAASCSLRATGACSLSASSPRPACTPRRTPCPSGAASW